MPNPVISSITLPSGTTYDFKDADARAAIEALSGYVTYAGVTTTELEDGSTTNPVVINGQNVQATTGMIVTYQNKEFVWNGSAWQEFGDLSALGEMAYADTASGSYTPQGTISFTNSNQTATVSAAGSGDATYTPAGSVSLTNSNVTATVSAASSGTATYTPAGSVNLTTTATTPSISASEGTSSDKTFQCSGSVSAPTISIGTSGSTTTIHNPTKATVATAVTAAAPGASAPTNNLTYYSVANETLSLYQIGYTTGDSISVSDVTVKTGDASYTAGTPTFTGGYVKLSNGSIDVPTSASFSGTGARLVTDNISVPSSASFSGTGARLVTGNISVPSSASFSGSTATITVYPDESTPSN